jgi:hypothetical protein
VRTCLRLRVGTLARRGHDAAILSPTHPPQSMGEIPGNRGNACSTVLRTALLTRSRLLRAHACGQSTIRACQACLPSQHLKHRSRFRIQTPKRTPTVFSLDDDPSAAWWVGINGPEDESHNSYPQRQDLPLLHWCGHRILHVADCGLPGNLDPGQNSLRTVFSTECFDVPFAASCLLCALASFG